MKIVGNCPDCGNPIYGRLKSAGQCVEQPLRTCFCQCLPKRTTIQVAPTYVPQPFYPPTLPYWSNAADPCSTIQTTANTGVTYTTLPPQQRPPDEDAGMVPK